jgi:hypothetical protein
MARSPYQTESVDVSKARPTEPGRAVNSQPVSETSRVGSPGHSDALTL